MTSVRMEWTLDEFYADGGVVSFTDRVAAALGINAWDIKTVAVYEGSVIVEFYVVADVDEDDKTEEEIQAETDEQLAQIADTLHEMLSNGELDVGAPVIGAITNNRVIQPTPENEIVRSKNFVADEIDESTENLTEFETVVRTAPESTVTVEVNVAT